MTLGYLAGYLRVLYNVTSNNADLGNGADGTGDCDPQPLFFARFPHPPSTFLVYLASMQKVIELNTSFVLIRGTEHQSSQAPNCTGE
jgi:hypothetical protein